MTNFKGTGAGGALRESRKPKPVQSEGVPRGWVYHPYRVKGLSSGCPTPCPVVAGCV